MNYSFSPSRAGLALFLSLACLAPVAALAATTPSLGSADTYDVLSSTYTNTVVGTTITGDIGFTTPPAVPPAGVHANYGSAAPYAAAGVSQGTALAALASQPCTFTFAPGAVDLSTDTTHGTAGVFAPGVYCSTGAMTVGGPLNLNGVGTYIFRAVGALGTTTGSNITLTGASACDVFWTPSAAATLGTNSNFMGTIISAAGVTIGANVTLSGRALAFGGTVTTDTDTITMPVCAAVGGGSGHGLINVVKVVVNDNGGTKTVADFPLFVNGLPVVSGVSHDFKAPADVYTVTETSDASYKATFSGDCDVDGRLNLNRGDNRFCIITNDDVAKPATAAVVPPVPPLLDLVKVPSPLALPDGPGSVTYTYTLRNVGTVPVSDITLVGDTCSPIVLASGDTNGNGKLDVSETWVHRCTTTLSETHTNTVVATGWANGISATDIASATVVVGTPVVSPLIHVTKIPSPLALKAGGGVVTFTERVTNPGTVPLNGIVLTDDKCAPMKYVSGDANGDAKLDSSETWTYTCQSRLARTTTNTAVASGSANGQIVRDFAIATVVVAVAVPALPKTGFAPVAGSAWPAAALLLVAAAAALLVARARKTA